MCLALPARIVSTDGAAAWVVLGDSRFRASLVLVPEAGVGDWVLVHAGFALERLTEEEARETWEVVGEVVGGEVIAGEGAP